MLINPRQLHNLNNAMNQRKKKQNFIFILSDIINLFQIFIFKINVLLTKKGTSHANLDRCKANYFFFS